VTYTIDPRRLGAIMAWLAGTAVGWDGKDGDPPIV
jgi:hypothetical protein